MTIWEANRRIYFRLQRREDWLQRPRRRIALLLGVIALSTVPVATVTMWIWQQASGDPGAHPYAIHVAVLAAVTGVVFITHTYETVFLLRDWESDRLRRARTEQARLEAELEALGREVDPHFLFNQLNVLVHLVDQHSAAAVSFVMALSETYRYVLEARGLRLVPLGAELEALRRHDTLARIRLGAGFRLRVEVDAESARRFALPPVSIGELFQNAIKHNDTSRTTPLEMVVRLEQDVLIFENDHRPVVRHGVASTGLGLTNMSQRFQLATGRPVIWTQMGARFVVRLPLVSTSP